MTDAEHRVAIAQDVLDQVAASRTIPACGVLLDVTGPNDCNACAVGALVAASLRRQGVPEAHLVGIEVRVEQFDSVSERMRGLHHEWEPPLATRDVDPMRSLALHALGNIVVPHCAEVAGLALRAAMGDESCIREVA